MTALARFVLRHRRLVGLAWLLVFISGVAFVGKTVDRLSFDFSLPGQPGYETATKVLKTYGIAADQPPILLVISAPAGRHVDPGQTDRAFDAVQKRVPAVRVVGHAQTGDTIFLSKDGRSTFAYAFGPLQQGFVDQVSVPLGDALKAAAPAGTTATVSGIDALATGGDPNAGPGLLAETLIGGVGALGVLVFVFASFLALVPLVVAAVAILATFLILLPITYVSDVSFIVQFLVGLIGLGVAIDYSLLLVTRWREECAHGRSNHDAVVAAMETAGHAVVFSGLTVAVGLVALILLPVPFLRSIGYGGMLIPLVSMAVSLTLLPALLGGIGPKVDWPRIRHEQHASRFWVQWGRGVIRRPWLATAAATVVLVALIVQFFGISIGTAQSESLASSGPAYQALRTLDQGGVPRGVLTPIVLVTENATAAPTERLRIVPGIVAAFAPSGPVANQRGMTLSFAIPRAETANRTSVGVVRDVRSAVGGMPGVVGITGVGALELDYFSSVYANFITVLALILVVTYILLVRAFRSLLLPLKAVILNVASVSATFGGLVIFWQYGHGSQSIYGIAPTGAITFWLPIMIFAFLFGLSMDYEVFILARVREEYDAHGDTNTAIVQGLGRTGRLVTSAALILFLSFLSLSSGPQTDIKVFATGLGFGILLDATIVRMLLVPALVSLFGDLNWYLPDRVARLLRIAPSHARNGRREAGERAA